MVSQQKYDRLKAMLIALRRKNRRMIKLSADKYSFNKVGGLRVVTLDVITGILGYLHVTEADLNNKEFTKILSYAAAKKMFLRDLSLWNISPLLTNKIVVLFKKMYDSAGGLTLMLITQLALGELSDTDKMFKGLSGYKTMQAIISRNI